MAIPFRLVPFLEYPNACSSVTERFCEQSGMLSPLEAAGEKTLFSRRNSLCKVFGYPALEKKFEKVDSEYDLCLFKLLCADTMYVFCMRSADFIADNFGRRRSRQTGERRSKDLFRYGCFPRIKRIDVGV